MSEEQEATLRYVALTALALTLAAHLASFVPDIPITPLYIPILFGLVFVAFGGMILSFGRYKRRFLPAPGEGWSGWWARGEAHNRMMGYAFGALPGWAQALTIVVFLYVGINFLSGLIQLREGQPETNGRRFWLQDHGKYVREISESEFHLYQARQVRFFSGHYLAFVFPPVLWFTFVVPALQRSG